MIKTEDFIKPYNCQTVDERYHNNLEAESTAITEMVNDAKRAMFIKLILKHNQGWHGWDNPDNLPILKNKLAEHIMKDFTPDNMVDVMNLAAMIRNQLV